jgi:hypothetical protein
MAITVSNRGAITERPTVAVHNMAAAVGTSTVMVPPIVTQNKHRSRRSASGDGSGTGITGFVPVSEHKRDVTERRSRKKPAFPVAACLVYHSAYLFFDDFAASHLFIIRRA